MNGTDPPRCRNHLGRKPEIVRAEYFARQQAETIFAQHGVEKLERPLDALRDVAAEVLAWQGVCREMLGSLDEIRYKSGRSGEQLRAEVGLYERAIERSAKVLADLVRLGIEDRQAVIARRDGQLMAVGIRWLLARLGAVDEPEVDALVVEMLRAISTGAELPEAAPLFRLVPVVVGSGAELAVVDG